MPPRLRALLLTSLSCWSLSCATGGGAPAPSAPPAKVALTAGPPALNLPACKGPAQVPADDAEALYGLGSGSTVDAAKQDGIADVARRREVDIRALLDDRQVDWRAQGSASASGARGGYQQTIEQRTQSSAAGRFRGCVAAGDVCLEAGQARAIMRCDRPGRALARELRKLGGSVGEAVPKEASLIVIPATNDGGWITQFGEYATRLLREGITASLPPAAHLRSIPRWDPAELHEVARRYQATHAIQAEHMSAGGGRILFRAWVVDLATEQPVPRSEAAFELELEPEQQELITVRGPLFPNRDAWALSANRGEPLAVAVSKPDLREGELVELQFSLPNEAYVYLFDIYEDGRAALLIPNPAVPQNRFASGARHAIPDDAWRAAGLSLLACPLPGRGVTRENLKLVASPTPLDLDITHFRSPDMVTLQGGPQGNLGEVRAALDRLRMQGVPIREGAASYVIHAVAGPTRCK